MCRSKRKKRGLKRCLELITAGPEHTASVTVGGLYKQGGEAFGQPLFLAPVQRRLGDKPYQLGSASGRSLGKRQKGLAGKDRLRGGQTVPGGTPPFQGRGVHSGPTAPFGKTTLHRLIAAHALAHFVNSFVLKSGTTNDDPSFHRGSLRV